MPDLSDVVNDAAQSPKSTNVDGTTVEKHGLKELDDVARRQAANAAVKRPQRGLRFNKLVPPGANG